MPKRRHLLSVFGGLRSGLLSAHDLPTCCGRVSTSGMAPVEQFYALLRQPYPPRRPDLISDQRLTDGRIASA